MLSKLNVTNIIRDHISTLKEYPSTKVSKKDLLFFFSFPLIFSGLSLGFGDVMTGTMVTLLTTALSIFAALLFNLLLLLYDAIRKLEQAKIKHKMRKTFLQELFSNISFCILVAVLSIVLLLIYSQVTSTVFQNIATFVCYYLVTLFILTLFMILKRTHILLTKEIELIDTVTT